MSGPCILVTGAGGAAGRNFIKSLRMSDVAYKIVGVDANSHHLSCNDLLDERYVVPRCTEDPDGFLQALEEIVPTEGVDLVHPQPDVEVRLLAHSGRFNHVLASKICLPPIGVIEVCQDKLKTNRLLQSRGVAAPLSFPVDSPDMPFPSWVRARVGAGSKASLPIGNRVQLAGWLDYWGARGLSARDFMASEVLPGREYAFQSLWWKGQLICSASRRRLEYAGGTQSPSGQTSSPSIAVSVHDARVSEVASSAVHAVCGVGPHGVFCVDLKESRGGHPKVMEINAGRFFTTSDFFSSIGCNMPHMLVQLFLGGYVHASGHDSVPQDVYWIRGMDRLPQTKRP